MLVTVDGDAVVWATDLNTGAPALLFALLEAHGQQVLYIPGRIGHHAAATYRGDGKTDAKDARIIADQARMRRDLQPVRGADQISTDLRLLTSHRTDLVYDRVRLIKILRALLLEYFPALEAAFDYSKKAPLVLLSGFQSADAIRMGEARFATWLRKRGCRNSSQMAVKAVTAARAQDTTLRTQPTGALVARMATKIIALDLKIAEIDAMITKRFSAHRDAEILTSMPGFVRGAGGDVLGQHGW